MRDCGKRSEIARGRCDDSRLMRNPDAQVEVLRSEFPEDVAAGDCYEAEDEDGRPVLLQVLEVTDEGVLVDSNHPLAGQTLRFEVEGWVDGGVSVTVKSIEAGTSTDTALLSTYCTVTLWLGRMYCIAVPRISGAKLSWS